MKNDYTIIRIYDYSEGIDKAIAYYHSKWGREGNFNFIEDAIKNCNYKDIPQFFVAVIGIEIVGCCGLIANDYISRHDLYPWLCGVFVEEAHRKQGLAGKLLAYAEQEAKRVGYKALYLSTDHISFYERYNWEYIGIAYQPDGDEARIYKKKLDDIERQ